MLENEYEKSLEISEYAKQGLPDPVKGKEEMTFEEWLTYGSSRYWNSAPICFTHDGIPPEKEGCHHYILVYKNFDQAMESTKEFAPATWRHHSRGFKWWNKEV
jgi:hypothetical protein